MRPGLSLLAVVLLVARAAPATAQGLSGYDRQRGLDMLKVVHDDIAKNYFDPGYNGVAIEPIFDSAEARIKRAVTVEQVLATIALSTAALNDSHTLFVPPMLTYRADYGLKFRFVGDTCRVYEVTPGSDAAARGVGPGDAVLAVEGVTVTRRNLWQLEYLLSALSSRPTLTLVLAHPGAQPGQLAVAGKILERRRQFDPSVSVDFWAYLRDEQEARNENQLRMITFKEKAVIFSFPRFWDDPDWVNSIEKEARRHEAVIVDLRGNEGGSVKQLGRLLGLFHAEDVVVAHMKGRKKDEEFKINGKGENRLAQKLVVLVDAGSASASEVFARAIQLTSRGVVLGDRTTGAVRVSRVFTHVSGTQTGAFYGTNVTIGDLVMSDGGELENVGVVPDELVLPTGAQLAASEDPALARALTLVGLPATPAQAGQYLKVVP